MDVASKTLDRPAGMGGPAVAAPRAEPEGEAWSAPVFTTLMRVLGESTVNGIASRFQADLQNRFADRDNRGALARDAHTVSSTAGMLGFTHLSAAARAFETACARGDEAATDLSDLLRCRAVVADLLAQHLRPH